MKKSISCQLIAKWRISGLELCNISTIKLYSPSNGRHKRRTQLNFTNNKYCLRGVHGCVNTNRYEAVKLSTKKRIIMHLYLRSKCHSMIAITKKMSNMGMTDNTTQSLAVTSTGDVTPRLSKWNQQAQFQVGPKTPALSVFLLTRRIGLNPERLPQHSWR